jgi:predicted nucleotidyltransferase
MMTMEEAELRKCIVYNAVHGSRAYGTNIPGSDRDEKGIAILTDPAYYFGFSKFEQKDSGWEDENDRVIYDIRKFFRLALSCNPNIIETLYCRQEDVLEITLAGLDIRTFRDSFLSAKAAKTFGGYAVSQLKRLMNREKHVGGDDKKIAKHAMHLVRLLRMGIEICRDGEVNVWREDAADLLKIRQGLIPISQVILDANDLLKALNDAEETTCLPELPDYDGAQRLMMKLIKMEIEMA